MMTLLLLCAALVQDDAPVFTKFEFVRERVGHKVTADVNLANTTRSDLSDVKILVIFYDGDRELKRSRPAALAKLPREATAAFKIEAEQVEKFSRYEVLLEAGGKQRLYLGADPNRTPVAKKAEPAKLALVSGNHVAPAAFPGEAVVTLTARNSGELEAPEPTAVVTFVSEAGLPVHVARVRLESEVRGLSEETFEVRVPGVPAYEKVRLAVAHLAAEGPGWPGGGKEPQVEISRSRVVRLTDASVRVTGTIRNGLPGPAAKVTATFKFGGKSHAVALEGVLKPGETRDFETYIPDVPGLDGGSYSLSYEDAAGPAAPPPAPAKATSRRTETRPVEAGPLVKPPAEKAPEKPLVENAHARISVGMRSLGWIEGYSLKNGKYSGDVPILRMVFVDAEGKPCQPTGTIHVTLYEGQAPVKKVQRIITKESWKLEAGKVTNVNVRHDLLAYDAKANELWVAFHRTEGMFNDAKADVQLVIRDAGTWEWKGVHSKSSESAPRAPDKK